MVRVRVPAVVEMNKTAIYTLWHDDLLSQLEPAACRPAAEPAPTEHLLCPAGCKLHSTLGLQQQQQGGGIW